jgi:hypothetical protein
MTREEQLMQEYEDLTFKILMDRVSQAEGARLLEENERLLADPAAAVPESVQRRTEKTIQDAFDGRKKEFVHRSLRRALKVAVIAAILLATTATVVFAVSPTARAKMKNTIRNVYETHTDFNYTGDTQSPEELEITTGWLPEGFSVQDEGSIGTHTWEDYINATGDTINIQKSYPISMAVDTENADITYIDIQGYDAIFITKNDEVRVLWLNTDKNVVYFINSEGLPPDTILKIAENIS